MRYLNDDWSMKRGGDLKEADKWNMFGFGKGVTQQEKAFCVVSLHVCFETFFIVTASFILSSMTLTINNTENEWNFQY